MTKYECAAHISEHGTTDGKPGDQTGNEVSITPYQNLSNGGYNVAMRYNGNMAVKVRNRIVKAACRLANNENIGYAWPTRSTLYEQMRALKWKLNKCHLVKACNTDCSAFVGVVVNVALVPLRLASAIPPDIWTGNEREYLEARGFEPCENVNFETGAGLLPGDILVNYEKHTTIIIGNSPNGQTVKLNYKPNDKMSLDEVADNVIMGLYGNERKRRKLLKAAGFDPNEVQKRVNELMRK